MWQACSLVPGRASSPADEINPRRLSGAGFLRSRSDYGRSKEERYDATAPEATSSSSEASRTVEAPLSDAADVNMEKVRVRVVADTSASERESCAAQRKRVDPRHTQVNGLRLNVKTVLGDSCSTGAKRFVC